MSAIRKCVICGARIRNPNKKTTTCGSLCTKIKKSGMTREEYVRRSCEIDEYELEEQDKIRARQNREITREDLAEGRF
jgi:hypothetical protein